MADCDRRERNLSSSSRDGVERGRVTPPFGRGSNPCKDARADRKFERVVVVWVRKWSIVEGEWLERGWAPSRCSS